MLAASVDGLDPRKDEAGDAHQFRTQPRGVVLGEGCTHVRLEHVAPGDGAVGGGLGQLAVPGG